MLKQNLNTQISTLLSEIKKQNSSNPLLVSTNFSAIHVDLDASSANVVLTEEELAIANPTIERIEIEVAIVDYIRKIRDSFAYYKSIRGADLPEWLVMS